MYQPSAKLTVLAIALCASIAILSALITTPVTDIATGFIVGGVVWACSMGALIVKTEKVQRSFSESTAYVQLAR